MMRKNLINNIYLYINFVSHMSKTIPISIRYQKQIEFNMFSVPNFLSFFFIFLFYTKISHLS